MFNRDQLRELMRGSVKTVNVPEWGGDVGIRKLSATDLVYLRSIAKPAPEDGSVPETTPEENLNAVCEVLARGICDTDGNSCFTVDELRNWAADQMDIMVRLVNEVQSHNGMTQAANEELSKNSESGPTSDST